MQDHGPVRWQSVAIFLPVFLTLYYGTTYLVPPATMLIAIAEYIGVALVSVALIMAPDGRAAFQILGFRPAGRGFVLGGIVGALALSYIVSLFGLASDWAGELAEIIREPGQFRASLLLIAGFGPLAEELVFRGFFYAWLEGRWGARVAVLVSSLAFAAVHGEPASIALSLPPGLFLGWLRWRSNSIVPPLIVHMVNNAVFVLVAKYLDL